MSRRVLILALLSDVTGVVLLMLLCIVGFGSLVLSKVHPLVDCSAVGFFAVLLVNVVIRIILACFDDSVEPWDGFASLLRRTSSRAARPK